VSAGFDVFEAVRGAVAVVCEVPADQLTAGTRFADLGADSLCLVGIADLVEARAAEAGGRLSIDDATLCRIGSLGELTEDIKSRLDSPPVLSVAS